MFRILPPAASLARKAEYLWINRKVTFVVVRNLSLVTNVRTKKHYKLLIIGGGTGGCSMAAKFAPKLGNRRVAVIEPATIHYYQPIWTLVGAGIKTLEDSGRPMESVLPPAADWIRDKVVTFHPEESKVTTEKGFEIEYEYMIVAMGLQLNFPEIRGLPAAFDTPGVCSNYSPKTVNKTFEAMQNCKRGNTIFTFPNSPVKCPGAPQKIMYLAEDYFSKTGKRDNMRIIYNTSLEVIFGVKKYAAQLMKIVKARDIDVNFKYNLIEVKPKDKEAIFQKLGTNQTETFQYEMLHITPPMSAPDVLRNSTLVDKVGFLNVNRKTLQHVKYPNIFGIGDCTNLPTSRTAAAVAAESGILRRNLELVMAGKKLEAEYDGYTSCPLVTGYGRCILAEFDYEVQPLETFPLDQGKERWTMYSLKKDFMPQMYWYHMLKGNWEGPASLRKLMHLGFSK